MLGRKKKITGVHRDAETDADPNKVESTGIADGEIPRQVVEVTNIEGSASGNVPEKKKWKRISARYVEYLRDMVRADRKLKPGPARKVIIKRLGYNESLLPPDFPEDTTVRSKIYFLRTECGWRLGL